MRRIRVLVLVVVLWAGQEAAAADFFRGNCNNDSSTNIADAVFMLGVMFPGANGPNVPTCLDACDLNDDGRIDLADPIFLLSFLKPGLGGPLVPPPPFMVCGDDPTADPLDCAEFQACP